MTHLQAPLVENLFGIPFMGVGEIHKPVPIVWSYIVVALANMVSHIADKRGLYAHIVFGGKIPFPVQGVYF